MRDKWIGYLMEHGEHNENWKAYNIRHAIKRLSVMPEERTLRMEYVLKYHDKKEFWEAYVMNRDFEREDER